MERASRNVIKITEIKLLELLIFIYSLYLYSFRQFYRVINDSNLKINVQMLHYHIKFDIFFHKEKKCKLFFA